MGENKWRRKTKFAFCFFFKPCDDETPLPMLLDGSHRIPVPEVLPAICRLLLKVEEQYRKTALQHLVFLIENDEGMYAFLQKIGWQTWLFDLIVTKRFFCVH